MTIKQAEAIVSPHTKEITVTKGGVPTKKKIVYLYPIGRQFGSSTRRADPVPFDYSRAVKNVSTGGWGIAPNLKDEKTVLTVIEKAQAEFAEKQFEKDAEIEALKAQLAQLESKKTTKV